MNKVLLFTQFFSVLLSFFTVCMANDPILDNTAGLRRPLGNLPLYFIENQGQTDDKEVAYYVKGTDKTLYFTPDGITLALSGKGHGAAKRHAVKLTFVDAQPGAGPHGMDLQKAVFSYFKGRPEEWKTGIPAYSRIVYSDLWPGIDLVYSGTVNRLKYEFVVKPHADPGRIALEYRGVKDVTVGETGELRVDTPAGGFEDGVPYAYQVLDDGTKEVSMRYVLQERTGENRFSYGFEIGEYDPNEPLVLDPALLIYSGYIGGSADDHAVAVAVDEQGCAYITGYTESDESTFPVMAGPDLTFNTGWKGDVFIAKLNAQGTDLVYCGYIGGSHTENAGGIAVDGQGNAYVTGETYSDEDSFPVKVGPDLTFNGDLFGDAFIAKVNAQGTDLDYCGYIGGTDWDAGYDVAVDQQGNAHVTGCAASKEYTFPVKVGPDLTHNGSSDVFVAKVNAQGTDFEYCGYIGGQGPEWSYCIALDAQGNAYLGGWTDSDETSFPVTVGPDLTHNGTYYYGDAFVARVNPQGTGLDYCGYIGGKSDEQVFDIAVDGQGRACVAGWSSSTELSFPVQAGPDLTHNGGTWDAFVARVNEQGTGLDYCGYIGGADWDWGHGVALDDQGNAYVAGKTNSPESTFPVAIGPDLTFNGGYDVFIARVDGEGKDLDFCGYVGGKGGDEAFDIAVDEQGNAYVVGRTTSDESSFPLVSGPDLTYNGGGQGDAFVSKVFFREPLTADTQSLSEATGGTVKFTLDAGADHAGRAYILLGSITGTEPGTPLPGGKAALPLNWDLFTMTIISFINTNHFKKFTGSLDGQGTGASQLNLYPIPGAAGITMYFAFALNNPWDFVSNPVEVDIVP